MTMTIFVTLLIRVSLPFHKHQENRLAILDLPASKCQQAVNRLILAKDNALAALNITAQTMVLQHHLSRMFGGVISILHFTHGGLNVGLIADGAHTFAAAGLNATEGSFATVALQGEDQGALQTDFRVIAPQGVNSNALTAELHKYRLAGKTFEIVIN